MARYDVVRLSDGRLLEYGEAGSPDGCPVLFCHGTPSSGWIEPDTEKVVASEQARFISVYRPGYGRSSWRAPSSVIARADDVAELADALAIERFAVCGVSGGAAYALACGWALRERVVRVAVISGLGPPDLAQLASAGTRTAWWHARRFPVLAWARWVVRGGWEVASEFIGSRGQARTYRDTFRRGPWGPFLDVRLSAEPWGFPFADIKVPVGFWHGSDDSKVPLAVARGLAASIPGAQVFVAERLNHELSAPIREEAFHWALTGECGRLTRRCS